MPENKLGKQERYAYYAHRSLTALRRFARAFEIAFDQEAAEAGVVLTGAA
jgi:hypothetical protein